MIAALSPVESWVAWFLVAVCVGGLVYIVVFGGRRYRRIVNDHPWPPGKPIYVADGFEHVSLVRVLPSVYDHEARGDFDHDPIRDYEWCDDCNAALRRAFNRLADRVMGPRDADALMAAIYEELES
jgi:hypothetical protein